MWRNILDSKKYFYNLNVFKFILASVIAFFLHYKNIFSSAPFTGIFPINMFYSYGDLCVEAFFIISGITTIKSFENMNGSDVNILQISKKFITKKVKTLYPLMIISVLFAALGQFITLQTFGKYLITNGTNQPILSTVLSLLCINCGWISNLDMTSINPPTWYLSVLMICYGLACIVYFIPKRNLTKYLIMALISILGFITLPQRLQTTLLYQSCSRAYFAFFWGMLLWLLLKSSVFQKYKKIFAILSVIELLSSMFSFNSLSFYNSLYLYVLVICPLLICGFIVLDDHFQIKNKTIYTKLSELSYTIYLFNLPIFIWTKYIVELLHLSPDYSKFTTWLTVVIVSLLFSYGVNELLRLVMGKLSHKNDSDAFMLNVVKERFCRQH